MAERASDVRIQEYDFTSVMSDASSVTGGIVIVSNKGSDKVRFYQNDVQIKKAFGVPNSNISRTVKSALVFIAESSRLWAVRALGSGHRTSGLLLVRNITTNALRFVGQGIADTDNIDWDQLAPDANSEVVAVFYPYDGPGSYGDSYSARIRSHDTTIPQDVSVTSIPGDGSLAEGTYSYQVSAVGPNGETLVSSAAEIVISGSVNAANRITWVLSDNAWGYKIWGRGPTGKGLIATVGQGETEYIDYGNIAPDTNEKPITSSADAPKPSPIFTIEFFDAASNSSVPFNTYDVSFESMTNADGVDIEMETYINAASDMVQCVSNVRGLLTKVVPSSVTRANFAGGDSGSAPTSFDIERAWQKLKNRHVYDVNTLINGGIANPSVGRAMDILASTRGDSIALLDVPSHQQTTNGARNYRNNELNLSSTYSALFISDVEMPDTDEGKNVWVPMSGWAGALCARTSRVGNDSMSIAGLNRGMLTGIIRTRHQYDDDEATELFRDQVNYNRTFRGTGTALWEQQTLSRQNTARRWLSVRRMLNTIKVASYRYGIWYVQEPNAPSIIFSMIKTFETYLDSKVDAEEIKSYQIISDNRNNTTDMEINGIRRISILIVPVIPIHELELQIALTKEGVTFEELEAQLA